MTALALTTDVRRLFAAFRDRDGRHCATPQPFGDMLQAKEDLNAHKGTALHRTFAHLTPLPTRSKPVSKHRYNICYGCYSSERTGKTPPLPICYNTSLLNYRLLRAHINTQHNGGRR